MRSTATDGSVCGRILEGLGAAIGEDKARRYFGDGGAAVRIEHGRVVVIAGSRFIADLLSRRFGEALRDAARAALGEKATVEIRVGSAQDGVAPAGVESGWSPAAPLRTAAQPASLRARARLRRSLGTLRRLDDFVVGPGSALAYGEALRLAEAPDHEPGCPLFLHGDCGMGKTHLLQGIVERFRERRPTARVRWTTGEAFTNAFIAAIQSNSVEAFRRDHRDLDLLCVDDVHFLSNKTATQSELLHTFDAIGACGARVAMASDAHPKQIGKFCEKLVSRFLAGMVVRVERPDRETRIEIVRRFCAKRGLVVSEAGAAAIADRRAGSVRELEGAVIRVEATHRLLAGGTGEVREATVERALGAPETEGVRRPIAVREIAQRVSGALGVDLDDLFGRTRHRRVVAARSLTAYLARELTTHSFPEIARELNKPNHSTVITQCKRVAEQIEANEAVEPGAPTLRSLHASLRAELLGGARPA